LSIEDPIFQPETAIVQYPPAAEFQTHAAINKHRSATAEKRRPRLLDWNLQSCSVRLQPSSKLLLQSTSTAVQLLTIKDQVFSTGKL